MAALLWMMMLGSTTMIHALQQNSSSSSLSSSSLLETTKVAATQQQQDYHHQPVQQQQPQQSAATGIHLIVLVHGWMGNPSEMGYLQQSLEREAKKQQQKQQQEQQWQSQESQTTSITTIPEQEEPVVVVSSTEPVTIIVHSATCNEDRTFDGIAAGGTRLAQEVNRLMETLIMEEQDGKNNNHHHPQSISLSFVGNSLGGLYARYALSQIPSIPTTADPSSSSSSSSSRFVVRPAVFCTTATPHLGVSRHTYLPIPGLAETVIANVLQQTGRDLLRSSSSSEIIQEMTILPEFVQPLLAFESRIAHANAHQTDFQVPTATAAFVNIHSQSRHTVVASSTTTTLSSCSATDTDRDCEEEEQEEGADRFWKLTLDTIPNRSHRIRSSSSSRARNGNGGSTQINSTELAECLDSMGWRKVFWDVRSTLPSVPMFFSLLSSPFHDQQQPQNNNNNNKDKVEEEKSWYTSSELYHRFTSSDRLVLLPLGHTMMVANSKSQWYSRLNAGGRPIMDWVARDLVQQILYPKSSSLSSSSSQPRQ